jgi:hypothetical protein
MTIRIRTTITPAYAAERLGSRLVSAVLSRLPGRMGHAAAERHRSRGSPPVRRLPHDLGLPEIIEPLRYWDHP